ncbi:hypothetical protein BU23DRAFT_153146 [Bimuria novae-zelandiae CBS 107.79]|uniref:Beta/gamma crystallin 'Greek key' domain-containing protein n=1 Tax=Bimuria novae-zelandiae CBS 107.79 TaxID=1447943 RepID=A0A6A5VQX0_9PLEO|nr:hypothetical protein BU23DRAFT_153146 [Bimuria novae-zelandiae CBS 107.79]
MMYSLNSSIKVCRNPPVVSSPAAISQISSQQNTAASLAATSSTTPFKMQFTILAVALSLSSAVLGAPAPADQLEVKRATGHLFVCQDAQFKGRCQNLQFTTGTCFNLGNGFADSISSAGPDAGFTCTVWEDTNCSGRPVSFVKPGIPDFNHISPNLNDKISSYRCN